MRKPGSEAYFALLVPKSFPCPRCWRVELQHGHQREGGYDQAACQMTIGSCMNNLQSATCKRRKRLTAHWTVMNLFLIICLLSNKHILTRECLARTKGCRCLWRVHELIRPSCLWFALRIHPCCTCRNICPHCARPYSATVATAQWWTIFPLRDRPAKNWFCSNALKWYRNGARCVSSTSTRPKSSPKTKFCGILNPFGSTLRYEVMKCAVYWVSIGHGIGNGWYLVVLSQFEAVRGGIKKLFLFTFSQKSEPPPPLPLFWPL